MTAGRVVVLCRNIKDLLIYQLIYQKWFQRREIALRQIQLIPWLQNLAKSSICPPRKSLGITKLIVRDWLFRTHSPKLLRSSHIYCYPLHPKGRACQHSPDWSHVGKPTWDGLGLLFGFFIQKGWDLFSPSILLLPFPSLTPLPFTCHRNRPKMTQRKDWGLGMGMAFLQRFSLPKTSYNSLKTNNMAPLNFSNNLFWGILIFRLPNFAFRHHNGNLVHPTFFKEKETAVLFTYTTCSNIIPAKQGLEINYCISVSIQGGSKYEGDFTLLCFLFLFMGMTL